MSNVETKRIRHTNYVQFLLEVQELIQNGWSFVATGSTSTAGIQFTANFQRSAKQSETPAEVKKEIVVEKATEVEKQSPVKTNVKTTTKK